MKYKLIKGKDIKNHGKMIDGELHLDEGIYTKYVPKPPEEILKIQTNSQSNEREN